MNRERSTRKTPFVASVLSATIVIMALLMLSSSVESVEPEYADPLHSHFRYGHYTWTPVSGTTIEFTLQNAWRRDGYTTCVNTTTLSSKSCSGSGGLPGIGDVIHESIGGTVFSPGDGSSIGSPSPLGSLLYVVTSIDVTNNWLFGLALDPTSLPTIDTTISHTYASTGTFTARTDSCCRISSLSGLNAHINNPDGNYRVETTVNVGTGNSSPTSALTPIVQCPIGGVCSFLIPGSDPNGNPLTFRLSTSAEAAGTSSYKQPGPPSAPNPASISTTGLYTWDTTGATVGPSGSNTLYSTQVTIEDRDASGNVKSKSALDFLIQLTTQTGSSPKFNIPPTPQCGSTISGTAGTTKSFTVQASDADVGDTVSLNVAGLPLGATMSPTLPTSSNPVSSTFSWTPTATQTGSFVMTFTATDSTGRQALCSITIDLSGTSVAWNPVPGGGRTNHSPEAIMEGNTLHVFVRGIDGQVYMNSQISGSWSGWSSVPGGLTSSQPAAVLDLTGALRLYVQGIDNRLYVNTRTSGTWGGWSAVPGSGLTLSAPDAVLNGGLVQLLVRGLDNGIWSITLP